MNSQDTINDIIEESSKKDRIIAAYEVNPNVNKKGVADALDVSYEYVRQIFNDIENPDSSEWQKLREGDLEKYRPPELLDAVEERFREEGVLPRTLEDSTISVSREQELLQSTALNNTEEMVAVEDLLVVRERMKLLLEQAQYTGSNDAEFVARKGIEWLNELIDTSE